MIARKKRRAATGFALASGLLFCGPAALADCAGTTCGNVTIDRLYVHSAGISVLTSGDERNLTDCVANANPDYSYITLRASHPLRSEIYALLLTAHHNRSPVGVRVEPNNASCEVSYVVSDK